MKDLTKLKIKIASARFLAVLFTLGVFLLCGFIAIIGSATSNAFYKSEFEKNNTLNKVRYQSIYLEGEAEDYIANLTEEQLLDLMDHTMDYCLFLKEDLNPTIDGVHMEVFLEDEYVHMIDVKNIFGGGIIIVAVGLVFVITGLVLGLIYKEFFFKYCRKTPYYTLIATACVLLAIALFAAIDFNTAFILFHQIFFAGKQWTFSSGVMIAMIGDIFTGIVPIILGVWVVLLAVFVACLILFNRYLKKRYGDKNAKSLAESKN